MDWQCALTDTRKVNEEHQAQIQADREKRRGKERDAGRNKNESFSSGLLQIPFRVIWEATT